MSRNGTKSAFHRYGALPCLFQLGVWLKRNGVMRTAALQADVNELSCDASRAQLQQCLCSQVRQISKKHSNKCNVTQNTRCWHHLKRRVFGGSSEWVVSVKTEWSKWWFCCCLLYTHIWIWVNDAVILSESGESWEECDSCLRIPNTLHSRGSLIESWCILEHSALLCDTFPDS